MLRVQVVCPHLALPGGVASYFNVVLPRLRQAGSLDVMHLPVGRDPGSADGWHALTDQWRVYQALRAARPDLVHINPSLGHRSFFRDALIIAAAKRLGLKVLVFFRGWNRDFARHVNGYLAPVFRSSYGRADGFIVLAEEFADRLREWKIVQPIHRMTTVVDEAVVDEQAVRRRLTALASGGGRLRILFMSRLEPEKGALQTVEAVHRLLRDGQDLDLSIAGAGEARADIEAYLDHHPSLRERIVLVGHVSGPAKCELLRSHDLFCLPTSYGEGMPNAVLEAMACGMGVITSPVGGLADFFRSPLMGELVPGNQTGPIETALRRLIAHRRQLAAVGDYNFAYAREHFYASTVAARLASIYRATVG